MESTGFSKAGQRLVAASFLPVCLYHQRVRPFSLFLLFLPLFRHPTSLGMLMSFFRNPSSLIRGTSPARFFVSERMSRLIDEWWTYTLRCGTSGCVGRRCWHVSEVSEATFCRVLLYAGHPDISTDRDKYSMTGRTSKKVATMSPIEEKNIVSKMCGARYLWNYLALNRFCRKQNLNAFIDIINCTFYRFLRKFRNFKS